MLCQCFIFRCLGSRIEWKIQGWLPILTDITMLHALLWTSNPESFFGIVHDLSLPTGIQYETGWHIDIELVNHTNGMINLVTTNDGVWASMDVMRMTMSNEMVMADMAYSRHFKTPTKNLLNELHEPSTYSSLPSYTYLVTSVAFAILITLLNDAFLVNPRQNLRKKAHLSFEFQATLASAWLVSILILYDSLTNPQFSPVFLGGENSPLWCSKFVGYNPRQLLASSSTFLSSNFCALYQLYHHPRIGLSEKDIGPPDAPCVFEKKHGFLSSCIFFCKPIQCPSALRIRKAMILHVSSPIKMRMLSFFDC